MFGRVAERLLRDVKQGHPGFGREPLVGLRVRAKGNGNQGVGLEL